MNKREYCESRESIAYYSGLNGLEIKGIEYGINDFVYCVSGCWYGGKALLKYANRNNTRRATIPPSSRDKAMFAEKFDIVEISKNKTYWFFGARFAREVE